MWALLAALLAFSTAAWPAFQTDFTADGLKALDEQRYEAAAQAFTKAIEADPKDHGAHFYLGLAYSFLGKDAEGVAEYRKALELKPRLYEAELNTGILLLRQKNPADALPLLADAVEQKPAEFQPVSYLAEAQLATGSFDSAEASFRRAVELDPKSAASELGLARALARQEKLADSEPHYRKAGELDAGYRDALLELASLYEKKGQSAEAVAIYREFPDNAAAQREMAQLLLASKQYTDAIPQLEAAYAKSATQPNRVALVKALLAVKQLDRAMPLLEQAVAAEPGNYDLRMLYALTLRDQKKYPPAAAQFLEAAKLKPSDPQTWTDLGGVLYLSGAFPQSLAAFDKARELGENTAGNWFFRAIILDKLKQLKPALEAYQKFLSLSHGDHPDQEFQARQRSRIIQRELDKR
jgi:tetratricopeptide (TPR) repeat protein